MCDRTWDFSHVAAGVREEEMVAVNCTGAVEGQLCRELDAQFEPFLGFSKSFYRK